MDVSAFSSVYVHKLVSFMDANDPEIELCDYIQLDTPCERDVVFSSYRLFSEANQAYTQHPRLAKTLYPELETQQLSLHFHFLILDIDSPDHTPLVDLPDPDGFITTVIMALEGMETPPSCVYSTRAGFRALWYLSTPITDPDEWDGRQMGMIKATQKTDIPEECVDVTAAQWSRLFRAPNVHRRGYPAIESVDHKYYMFTESERYYDPEAFDIAIVPRTLSVVTDVEAPDPIEALNLVECLQDGVIRPTVFGKLARTKLRGTIAFSAAFDECYEIPPGQRDHTVCSIVGTALNRLPDASLIEVYGLFVAVAQAMGLDQSGMPFTELLWNKIQRFGAQREMQKQQDKVLEKELKEMTPIERCVLGMQKWVPRSSAPDLYADEELAWEYIRSHAFANHADRYYKLTEHGVYATAGDRKNQLQATIKHDTFMRGLLGTVNKGQLRVPTPANIMANNTSVVYDIEMIPEATGGRISDINTDRATLVVGMYRIDPKLASEFNADVDDWLKSWTGNHYQDICRWIAWSLAFKEGPTCALSIQGFPGIGKGMLVQGLAEALEVPNIMYGEELVGDFRATLKKTPFICVNEGWPIVSKRHHPANLVRELIGSSRLAIDEKFKSVTTVYNPCRLILTANNESVVSALTKGQILERADKEALISRVYHMVAPSTAFGWLSARGGRMFTKDWIRPDDGTASKKILAKHFLWLYENRHDYGHKGNRFLCDGSDMQDNQIHRVLSSDYQFTPLVVEAILKLIGLSVGNGMIGGTWERDSYHYDVEAGILEISAKAVNDIYRQYLMAVSREPLTMHKIKQVLQNFAVHVDTGKYYLDCVRLMSSAMGDGFTCKILENIAATQYQQKTGERLADKLNWC